MNKVDFTCKEKKCSEELIELNISVSSGPFTIFKSILCFIKNIKMLKFSDFSFNFNDLSKTNYVKHIQNYAPKYLCYKISSCKS